MSNHATTSAERTGTKKWWMAAVFLTVACATLFTGDGGAATRVPMVEYFTNLY